MNILVIAATQAEIQPSIAFLEEQDIPFLISGVGMLATVYTLTKSLQTIKPDLIIQVGIGGILDSDDELGAVYQIVEDEIFAFGAEDSERFLPIAELGFGEGHFRQQLPPSPFAIPVIPQRRGITVNKVHGNTNSIEQLRHTYDEPIVESMEGVAAFFVAAQENIPVLQFRASSNYIEPRNRDAWQIGSAIKNLNLFLQELLKSLP